MSSNLDKDFFHRLDGLGSIKPGHKYNVKTKTSSVGDSWWTVGERKWYKQDKSTLTTEIRDLLKIIRNNSDRFRKEYDKMYKSKCQSVVCGLNNLMIAYKSDSGMVTELKTYQNLFNSEINKFDLTTELVESLDSMDISTEVDDFIIPEEDLNLQIITLNLERAPQILIESNM